MIQNILPLKLDITFKNLKPDKDSIIMIFDNDSVLVCDTDNRHFPRLSEINDDGEYIYLFSIDDDRYFLCMSEAVPQPDGYVFKRAVDIRWDKPKENIFAMFTAFHLFNWYRTNVFCGACGHPMINDTKERMLKCEHCGNMVYPRISPAIIVAITDGERILLTRYNGRVYKRYALVAGFCEIGETAQETVAREVMEEVGLRVCDIKYYGTQPWGLTGGLLLGYTAKLDGDDTITLDKNELSEAIWVNRKDMEVECDDVSLTNDMMCAFRDNRI